MLDASSDLLDSLNVPFPPNHRAIVANYFISTAVVMDAKSYFIYSSAKDAARPTSFVIREMLPVVGLYEVERRMRTFKT